MNKVRTVLVEGVTLNYLLEDELALQGLSPLNSTDDYVVCSDGCIVNFKGEYEAYYIVSQKDFTNLCLIDQMEIEQQKMNIMIRNNIFGLVNPLLQTQSELVDLIHNRIQEF